MSRALKFLSGVVLFALCGTAVFAETEFKAKRLGDWSAIENAWKYSNDLKSQEYSHWASTDALDGRHATFGIARCTLYGVDFSFDADAEFNGDAKDNSFNVAYDDVGVRIVYTTVLPSDVSQTVMFNEGVFTEWFYYDPAELIRGAKFRICPTKQPGPRCLTFSLKGISAALKMVCPKR